MEKTVLAIVTEGIARLDTRGKRQRKDTENTLTETNNKGKKVII